MIAPRPRRLYPLSAEQVRRMRMRPDIDTVRLDAMIERGELRVKKNQVSTEQIDQRYNRWLAWYHDGCGDGCQPEPEYVAEWPDLDEDEGESKAEYIVRCDVPAMRDEIQRLTEALAASEAKAAGSEPCAQCGRPGNFAKGHDLTLHGFHSDPDD